MPAVAVSVVPITVCRFAGVVTLAPVKEKQGWLPFGRHTPVAAPWCRVRGRVGPSGDATRSSVATCRCIAAMVTVSKQPTRRSPCPTSAAWTGTNTSVPARPSRRRCANAPVDGPVERHGEAGGGARCARHHVEAQEGVLGAGARRRADPGNLVERVPVATDEHRGRRPG